MNIIGGTIISFDNGKKGRQPALVIQAKNGEKYLIVSSPERRFLVTEMDSN